MPSSKLHYVKEYDSITIMFFNTPLIITIIFTLISNSLGDQWSFPKNFKFGVSTSAYQIEGGWDADGKGPSMWDVKTQAHPELVDDRSNAQIACDSYHKWEEDVEIVKELGVDIYRFSLSWPRILPNGYINNVNQAGVDYYNKLINRLLEKGIEPVVSIFHWDLPEMFVPLGGWMNPKIVDLYVKYARLAFSLFGDRVKTWITFNEPRLICQVYKGLLYLKDATEYPTGSAEYLCAHHILKSHAEAYHVYSREFRKNQKGRISYTLDITWSEPDSDSPDDVEAAERARQFEFGVFAHPVFHLDYPEVMKQRIAERSRIEGFPESRLPHFTLAEQLKIKGTFDFLGVNHYVTMKTRNSAEFPISKKSSLQADMKVERYYDPSWEKTGADWARVTPWGMKNALKWIKESYNNPEILITESGYGDETGVLEDEARIRYLTQYMNATLEAMNVDDVNVTCYMAWSLMDNAEWEHGYTKKYGLYQVDFESPNRTRTPKQSVKFLKNVITTRTLP